MLTDNYAHIHITTTRVTLISLNAGLQTTNTPRHIGRVTYCIYIVAGLHTAYTYWQGYILHIHSGRVMCCIH